MVRRGAAVQRVQLVRFGGDLPEGPNCFCGWCDGIFMRQSRTSSTDYQYDYSEKSYRVRPER